VKILGIVLLACLIGCAHSGGGPVGKDETVRDDVAKAKAFLNGIPGCSSEDGAIALAELNPESPPPRIRAFLVRDTELCTQMKCNHECCNRCTGGWKLAAAKSGEAPVLVLSPEITWQAMDCSLASVKSAARPIEVVVTGTIRERKPDTESTGLPVMGDAKEIAHTAICGAR
jgi:hypothetical protein